MTFVGHAGADADAGSWQGQIIRQCNVAGSWSLERHAADLPKVWYWFRTCSMYLRKLGSDLGASGTCCDGNYLEKPLMYVDLNLLPISRSNLGTSSVRSVRVCSYYRAL